MNLYLIEYLSIGYDKSRAGTFPYNYDWDLLGLIHELRRSLYGGLSEEDLRRFIYDGKPLPRMKGQMGFYCLLNNSEQLRELDGWMLSIVRRAMRKRRTILSKNYKEGCPSPSNKGLATGYWLDLQAWDGNEKPDPRMPSFVRGWRAARKHFFTFGLEDVQAPNYGSYSDIESAFSY